jgi:hypothetical protein
VVVSILQSLPQNMAVLTDFAAEHKQFDLAFPRLMNISAGPS